MTEQVREEQAVFEDLAGLCLSEGYVYVLGWLAVRDGLIHYEEQVKPSDLEHLNSPEHLVRTEFATLAGLAAKGSLSLVCPTGEQFTVMLDRTDSLLQELHATFVPRLTPEDMQAGPKQYMSRPDFFREMFVYSGEPAYYFQYRDLVHRKYGADDDWLLRTMGFTVDDLDRSIKAICALHQEKVSLAATVFTEKGLDSEALLNLFSVSVVEISGESGVEPDKIRQVLSELSLRNPCNSGFLTLSDFNEYNARPLIPLQDDSYLLFQIYSIVEAAYESPYYWMVTDKLYIDAAMTHRGFFTEEYSSERLRAVFGGKHTYSNVLISGPSKQIAGEIDVLVVFADRAIVLQAKSKKLTIESRKGNTRQIERDFQASVQDAYDQGLSCAQLLGSSDHTLIDQTGNTILQGREFKKIYIFCVVLDPYPALSYQSREFLKYLEDDVIRPPFVMDIFFLDTLCEMLATPLRFLHYVNARIDYIDRVNSVRELSVLSFHLQNNLYIQDDVDFVYLEDSVSIPLDIGMMARRAGIPGNTTPDGILTRYEGSTVGQLVASIESTEQPAAVHFGFFLLDASQDTINEVNAGIDKVIRRAVADKSDHDFGFGMRSTGVTFHCNGRPTDEAAERLFGHCRLKAYSMKADEWFGILLAPEKDPKVQCGIHMCEPWVQSDEMDRLVREVIGANAASLVPEEKEKAVKASRASKKAGKRQRTARKKSRKRKR